MYMFQLRIFSSLPLFSASCAETGCIGMMNRNAIRMRTIFLSKMVRFGIASKVEEV